MGALIEGHGGVGGCEGPDEGHGGVGGCEGPDEGHGGVGGCEGPDEGHGGVGGCEPLIMVPAVNDIMVPVVMSCLVPAIIAHFRTSWSPRGPLQGSRASRAPWPCNEPSSPPPVL